MSESMVYAEHSGDHRNGPIAVPGPQTTGPWGIRWQAGDPEPWPGFAQAVSGYDCVFVHGLATDRPTTSAGRGEYSYWKDGVVADVAVYYTDRVEDDATGSRSTITLALREPVVGFDAWVTLMTINPFGHTLADGSKLIHLSGHEFKFSDGTIAPPQKPEIVALFDLKRSNRVVRTINGMALLAAGFEISDVQLWALDAIVKCGPDLVLVPVMLLDALRLRGVRDQYPNVVAFNATEATRKSPATEKIVDISRWSY